MNRQQLRDKAKREGKLVSKIKSLPGDVLRGIEEMQRQAVAETTQRIMEQIDTCYVAAIITFGADKFSMDELEGIRDITDKYLIENGDFIKEFKEGWKEYLNKMEYEVKERALELIETGEKQIDIIKTLKKEYPKLTTSHLNIAYKTAKEEYMKPKVVIANEINDYEKEKMREMVNIEKGIKNTTKLIQTETKTPVIQKEVKKASKLKLKSKELILEGEYGEYKIKNGTLESGSLTFKNIEEIYKYSDDEIRKFKETIEELKQAWSEV